MLTHLSISCGIPSEVGIPETLTKNGILSLSFHDLDTIKDRLFAI